MRRWIRRLRALFARDDLEREIDEELRDHIERETAWLLSQGVAPAEARRQAKLRFGAMDATKTEVRRVRGVLWLDDAVFDVRVGLRGFVKRPGLSVAVVATLALGLGASAVVFASISAVLLRAPAYSQPERLVFVWQTAAGERERLRVPGPDAARVETGVGSFEAVGFLAGVTDASLPRAASPALPLRLARASSNWFSVLGVPAALGRAFDVTDGLETAPTVWLLDDAFFRTQLGADPAVIGRPLILNGREGIVIGVLPASYRLLLPPELDISVGIDVWEPIRGSLASLRRPDRVVDQDADDTGVVVARLRALATAAGARAELAAVSDRLQREVPAYADAGISFSLRPLQADAVARAGTLLRAVFVAVLLVLFLAIVNASGLLLTRATARSREMAVRAALGAARGRLLRQVATENGLLVIAGLVAGLGVALWMLSPLSAYVAALAPGSRLRVDPLLILFCVLAAAVVIALTSAIVLVDPSLRAATGALTMRGGASWNRSARRLRDGLVALQVALSFALLAGAGVMVRTAASLARQDLGFRATDVLTFRIGIAFPDRYRGPADRAALVRSLEERIGAIAGVEAVGFVGGLPLADPAFRQPWSPVDAPATPARANYRVVTTGTFDALGTRLLAGRFFRAEDDRQDRRVVIVDSRLATRLAPSGDAVGRTLRVPIDGEELVATVVGVVENVRFESLAAPGRETIYVPYRHEASRRISAVVRAGGDLAALTDRIRTQVASTDPGIAVHDARPMKAIVAESMRAARGASAVLVGFATLALVLAVVGLYAALAYAVTRRTVEIGVRMALGATSRRILGEVMRTGMVPLVAGLSIGFALVVPLGLALRSLVFGVVPLDPVSLLAAAGLLTLACTAACYGAASRAARIAPARALVGQGE